MDWKKILGPYDTQSKRTQASLAMFEMTNAGVGEPLAIEVVKQIFAKDTVVKGERERLITEAIAGVTKVERAVVKPDELRGASLEDIAAIKEHLDAGGKVVATDLDGNVLPPGEDGLIHAPEPLIDIPEKKFNAE